MILRYPVDFIAVTQYFKEGYHTGMDLGWSSQYFGENQNIYAAGDGEVIEVRNDYNSTDTSGSSYGNYVKIKHNETFTTLYAHLKYQSVTVNVGDYVKQVIEKFELNEIEGRERALYMCSALKGYGVKDGIKWILEKLSLR